MKKYRITEPDKTEEKRPFEIFFKDVAKKFRKFMDDLFKEFYQSKEFSEAFEKFLKRKFKEK